MQVLNGIYSNVSDYYNQIPANTTKQIITAAGFAFILSQLVFQDLTQSTLIVSSKFAGFSALATLIHALVTPLFKWLNGGANDINWLQEMGRTFTAIIGTGAIARVIGDQVVVGVDLRLYPFVYGFLSGMKERQDLNKTNESTSKRPANLELKIYLIPAPKVWGK